jgi:hypothetical protein
MNFLDMVGAVVAGVLACSVLWLLLREFNCFYFKINKMIRLLEDIRAALPARPAVDGSGAGSAYPWIVRVQSKLRPMKHEEYPASLTEVREALKSGTIDPARTRVCAPGETEFNQRVGWTDMDKHGRTRTNTDGTVREYAVS